MGKTESEGVCPNPTKVWNLVLWKRKKGKASKITSANRVFPTPFLPTREWARSCSSTTEHTPPPPNSNVRPLLTLRLFNLSSSFPPFLFILHKLRVSRSFPTQIRRIGANLVLPALGALGLGFPSDVVCSLHWWICSRCVGSRSGAMLIDSIPSELSVAPSPGEKAETACSGSETSENMPPAISPWPSFRPTRFSKTRARSSPVLSVPSSEYTTVTEGPTPPDTFAITCFAIFKVLHSEPWLYRRGFVCLFNCLFIYFTFSVFAVWI